MLVWSQEVAHQEESHDLARISVSVSHSILSIDSEDLSIYSNAIYEQPMFSPVNLIVDVKENKVPKESNEFKVQNGDTITNENAAESQNPVEVALGSPVKVNAGVDLIQDEARLWEEFFQQKQEDIKPVPVSGNQAGDSVIDCGESNTGNCSLTSFESLKNQLQSNYETSESCISINHEWGLGTGEWGKSAIPTNILYNRPANVVHTTSSFFKHKNTSTVPCNHYPSINECLVGVTEEPNLQTSSNVVISPVTIAVHENPANLIINKTGKDESDKTNLPPASKSAINIITNLTCLEYSKVSDAPDGQLNLQETVANSQISIPDVDPKILLPSSPLCTPILSNSQNIIIVNTVQDLVTPKLPHSPQLILPAIKPKRHTNSWSIENTRDPFESPTNMGYPRSCTMIPGDPTSSMMDCGNSPFSSIKPFENMLSMITPHASMPDLLISQINGGQRQKSQLNSSQNSEESKSSQKVFVESCSEVEIIEQLFEIIDRGHAQIRNRVMEVIRKRRFCSLRKVVVSPLFDAHDEDLTEIEMDDYSLPMGF